MTLSYHERNMLFLARYGLKGKKDIIVLPPRYGKTEALKAYNPIDAYLTNLIHVKPKQYLLPLTTTMQKLFVGECVGYKDEYGNTVIDDIGPQIPNVKEFMRWYKYQLKARMHAAIHSTKEYTLLS